MTRSTRMRNSGIGADREPSRDMPGPMIVRSRQRARRNRTVSFQWYDGAGEMHYHALDPAESGPYLAEVAGERG